MNRFFESALKKAATSAVKPNRLLTLFTQLVTKLRNVDWSKVKVQSAKEKFMVMGRLIKAYALGEYRDISWRTILLVTAAIIYFINPVDLIPDLIPITGFTDDIGVLIWVYNHVNAELEKFIMWEQSRVVL
ncbi:YkvA family protein [Chryseosolibacter indicus]|uniref:DUF1232 domain-containing protein n=1 Tax=Chryseosolibacter indicus TaxID=2782351 RepID=A0ABS5VR00_9BACT|nr:YkvA family protein [Chryseosolibacter indicus]MBT1703873.1 DUF1232 domain-containing protein [Chryseosolibacter indicus]